MRAHVTLSYAYSQGWVGQLTRPAGWVIAEFCFEGDSRLPPIHCGKLDKQMHRGGIHDDRCDDCDHVFVYSQFFDCLGKTEEKGVAALLTFHHRFSDAAAGLYVRFTGAVVTHRLETALGRRMSGEQVAENFFGMYAFYFAFDRRLHVSRRDATTDGPAAGTRDDGSIGG
jgi:hypothetical protein